MRYRVILVSSVLATVALAGCGEESNTANVSSGADTSSATPSTTASPTPSHTTAPSPSPSPTRTQPPTSTTTTTKPPATTTTATTTKPPMTPKPTRPTESAAPVLDRCHTSDLWAVTRPLGVATGNSYAVIVLTNHSEGPCRIYGYGGMQLYTEDRQPLPTDVQRQAIVSPILITLRPGDHAYSRMQWGTVPDGIVSGCTEDASMLKVTPPDEHDTLWAHWPGGSICQHGKIFQDAYRAGTGPQS